MLAAVGPPAGADRPASPATPPPEQRAADQRIRPGEGGAPAGEAAANADRAGGDSRAATGARADLVR